MLKTMRCGPADPFATVMHSRKEPEPESFVLVTVSVAAEADEVAKQKTMASTVARRFTGDSSGVGAPGVYTLAGRRKTNRAAAAFAPRLDREACLRTTNGDTSRSAAAP